jgi:hypothetical protein
MQYVIKQTTGALWKEFIEWANSQNRNIGWNGLNSNSYYGFRWNEQGEFKCKSCLKSFGSTPLIITLEQWQDLMNHKTPSYEIY